MFAVGHMTTSPSQRALAILSAVGAKSTPAGMNLLLAWQHCENSNPAWYNPLDTTLPEPGAQSINKVGVKKYPSFNVGIKATASTLEEAQFRYLLDAIRTGSAPMFFAHTNALALWGTNPTCVKNEYAGLSHSPIQNFTNYVGKEANSLNPVNAVEKWLTDTVFTLNHIIIGIAIIIGMVLLIKLVSG